MSGIGLVGVGKWGANWLRTLASIPEVSLRWCCDLNEALLAKVRKDHPTISTTTSFDELLRDAATEGIVIASAAPSHFALAKKAIDAGKHVLVEKPMTLTSADALELNRLAERSRRVLMVGHLMEYHSAIPAIRRLIENGDIGEVQRIECRRANHGVLRTDENVWWSFAPHDISIVLRLMGDMPVSVRCDGQCIVQPHIADVVSGTLSFPGGRVARIDVSWHDPVKVRELKVYGTKKWVFFNDMLPWERKVQVHDRGFDQSPSAPPHQRITLRQGNVQSLTLDATEPLVAEARHFAECIRKNARPLTDGNAGIAVVSVLEHGDKSLQSKREIPIPKHEPEAASRKAA